MTVVEIRDCCEHDYAYAIAMSETMTEEEIINAVRKAQFKAEEDFGECSWSIEELVENLPDEIIWCENIGYMEV